MQQACVDDILMGNYTEFSDTGSLNNEIQERLDEINRYQE